MTQNIFLSGLAALTLAGCMQTAPAPQAPAAPQVDPILGERISTRAAFVARLAGKPAYTPDGSGVVTSTADGKISGKAGGGLISGSWTWQGDLYCRDVSVGGQAAPYDCQEIYLNGAEMTVVRNSGKGSKSSYFLR